jgi:hypothetical protein
MRLAKSSQLSWRAVCLGRTIAALLSRQSFGKACSFAL